MKARLVASIYTLFFLALFLQLPLRGLLPGNTDTLLAIALSNLTVERVKLFFSGLPTVTALYPARDVMAYGENCYGLVVLFELFRFLTRSDLWAYYLFTVTIFASNSFAAYKLIGLFTEGSLAPFLGGLVFSCLGFVFGNIDDPNIILLALPMLAVYFLELGCRRADRRLLAWGFAISGGQIWFGFYVFLFQALVLLVFGCSRIRELSAALKPRDFLRLALAYALPAVPLLAVYLHNHYMADVYSPYSAELTTRHSSLEWHNFANVGRGNLIYSFNRNVYGSMDVGDWHRPRKNAFPGVAFLACFSLGLLLSARKLRFPLALFLVFFALSFGVHLPFFEALVKLPFAVYFRVPLRFLLVALIPAAVFFARGLEVLRNRLLRFGPVPAIALIVGIAAFALAENVPFPLSGFSIPLIPPASYTSFFAGFSSPQVVLDLPSKCFYPKEGANESAPLWFYSRDILYMNWQTYHRQKIVEGVNSYVPRSRAMLDPVFQKVPEAGALEELKAVGVSYIVFHKKMIEHEGERVLEELKKSPALVEKLEDDDVAIFQVPA